MGFIQKFFKNKKEEAETEAKQPDYSAGRLIPADEKFTLNFKKNGGKFLYCETLDEVYAHFANILSENQWEGVKMLCYNPALSKKFHHPEIAYTHSIDGGVSSFLTTCEYLIADMGAILVSSNQIREKNLRDLPDNFVVFATTSQLVETIGEGLRGIKQAYQGNIPSNITTLKHFEMTAEKDFLSYGSSSKNVYLLLLEDL